MCFNFVLDRQPLRNWMTLSWMVEGSSWFQKRGEFVFFFLVFFVCLFVCFVSSSEECWIDIFRRSPARRRSTSRSRSRSRGRKARSASRWKYFNASIFWCEITLSVPYFASHKENIPFAVNSLLRSRSPRKSRSGSRLRTRSRSKGSSSPSPRLFYY